MIHVVKQSDVLLSVAISAVVKCKNKRGDAMCNVFASYARYCQTYEDYMKLHCAKACNLCGESLLVSFVVKQSKLMSSSLTLLEYLS